VRNLDIYCLLVPCAGLLMPLAGIGRSYRTDFARHSLPAELAEDVAAPRQARLSMHWRTNSDGELVMEWTA
jgi:hypothetical protein